jgi:hypothetical protein
MSWFPPKFDREFAAAIDADLAGRRLGDEPCAGNAGDRGAITAQLENETPFY